MREVGVTALRALLMAFLIGVFPVSEISAQPTQGVVGDFSGLSGLAGRPTITVVDDSGREINGRLLRFTPDSLTMAVEGRELLLDRQHVQSVYERGDALRNGTLIGLLAGAAFGIAGGVSGTDCGGYFERARPCTAGEKARLVLVFGGAFGAIGAGIGAGIDALKTGRRLLYQRPPSPQPASPPPPNILSRLE
jgi:hypothetical protein